MKVGIMTFWWTKNNYGQILQLYALQQYLKNHTHDVVVIPYKFENDYIRTNKKINFAHIKRFFLFKITTTLGSLGNNKRKFDQFRRNHIDLGQYSYCTYNDLKKSPPEIQAMIVGSDQVWNFNEEQKSILNAYFLDFGNTRTKRISYAASFGKIKINRQFMDIVKEKLNNFDYVSVRENSGKKLCDKLSIQSEVVCDPTFLHSKEFYFKISDDYPHKKNMRYCLLYLLEGETKFNYKNLKKWCKEKNIKILYVSANNRFDLHRKIYPNVGQWLSLIKNAAYIVTNSFHCAVFSIIFNKQFVVLKRKGNGEEMNTRFLTLFSKFSINQFCENDDYDILDRKIYNDFVKSVIEKNINSFDLSKVGM